MLRLIPACNMHVHRPSRNLEGEACSVPERQDAIHNQIPTSPAWGTKGGRVPAAFQISSSLSKIAQGSPSQITPRHTPNPNGCFLRYHLRAYCCGHCHRVSLLRKGGPTSLEWFPLVQDQWAERPHRASGRCRPCCVSLSSPAALGLGLGPQGQVLGSQSAAQ